MLLEIKDLKVSYGKIAALKGISLTVEEGEIVTLVGANGAGKTTTLQTISGLRRVSSGSVVFDGKDITSMPGHKRVGLGLCQAPEGRGIFPGMSVMENLSMGAYNKGKHRTGVPATASKKGKGGVSRIAEDDLMLAEDSAAGEENDLEDEDEDPLIGTFIGDALRLSGVLMVLRLGVDIASSLSCSVIVVTSIGSSTLLGCTRMYAL